MEHRVALRRFNRAFTQRIGVLDESYLGTGRPLGPSRVLFEIAADGGSPVLGLRRSLGLDSGHLSRLLRRLEAEGLVTVEPDPDDRRQRVVQLTEAGRDERRRIDDRADGVADALLAPLSPRLRGELAAALGSAERLLRAATVAFEVVDPTGAQARHALDRYFDELDRRFEGGFDRGDGGADGDAHTLRAPDGAFIVAVSDDDVVGCGGLQQIDPDTAEVKRMWIDDAWRGLGLGARLLARLEDEARWRGRSTVVLDTNRVLSEAIALYHRAGYEPTERYADNPYAHHWFTKSLRGPDGVD